MHALTRPAAQFGHFILCCNLDFRGVCSYIHGLRIGHDADNSAGLYVAGSRFPQYIITNSAGLPENIPVRVC
jgi:hypothetical protein